MIPLRRAAASGGPAGQAYLSTQAAAPQTVAHTPRPVEAGNFSLSIMWEFTPTVNVGLYGLTDTALHAGAGNIRLEVWRVSDLALLASSPYVLPASRTGAAYVAQLAGVLALTAGVAYRIGWAALNGNVARATSNTGAASAFAGFTTDRISYAPGNALAFPVNPVGNPDQFPVTFDLLIATASTIKNTQNPLDSVDFPIVAAAADLPVNAAAILDPSTSAPRLIRKRADGTVWYGPVFTNVP